MRIQLIVGVVFFVFGQVCMLIGGLRAMTLKEEVNARLPLEKRIDPIFWGPFNSWKMDRLQREMFPERWKRNWIVSFVGMAFFLIAIGIFFFGT
jgi:hypothetical protein